MREPFALQTILDIDCLQNIQDSFASAFKTPSLIIDPEGYPLTKPSYWRRVCNRIDGRFPEECRERFLSLLAVCGNTETPVLSQCPHSGLTSIAVPIVLDGHQLGAWILDQVLVDDCPELDSATDELPAWLCKREDPDGGDIEPLIVSKADFKRIFSLLMAFNRTMVRLGRKNRDMALQDRQLRNAHEQLDAANAMLRKFIDSSQVAMYICDFHTGELLMMNNAYCRMFRKPMEELIGRKCWHMNGNASDSFCAHCPREKLLDENNNPTEPHTQVHFNTHVGLWLKCISQAVAWTHGRLAYMVTILDVTQEYRTQERLRHLAFVDRQTSLPNGQKLLRDIREFTRSAHFARSLPDLDRLAHSGFAESLDFVCFDLSFFRQAAEIHGRDAGNELLLSILQWVREQEFGDATLYRTDADQFCIVMQGASENDVMAAADHIAARCANPWRIRLHDREFPYFADVPVAILFASRDELLDKDMLALIARALDAARSRKTIVIYDDEKDARFQEQLQCKTGRQKKNDVELPIARAHAHLARQPRIDDADIATSGFGSAFADVDDIFAKTDGFRLLTATKRDAGDQIMAKTRGKSG